MTVQLNPASRALLRDALGDDEGALGLVCGSIEGLLTTYRAVRQQQIDPRRMERYRRKCEKRLKIGRRLLGLLESSVEDRIEAHERGQVTSPLEEALQHRIQQWERDGKPLRRARPTDWDRRIFVYRLIQAMDAAGVSPSYYRQGARWRVLHEALRMADAIMKLRRKGDDRRRVIEAVYRDARKMTHGPLVILHLQYEHNPDWPTTCPCRDYYT